jgi:hypothetical protein
MHGYGTHEVQVLRVICTTAGEWGKPTHLKLKVKKIWDTTMFPLSSHKHHKN